MYRLQAIDRLRYFVERQLIKGVAYQLLVVSGVVALVSLIGGALILATGEESYPEAVWWAFLRLTDPGYLGDDAGGWRRTVSTGLTVTGYVLFMGTLVAILTQWLTRTIRLLEQGLTPVTMRHHIVVLGVGSRTTGIVRELLHSPGRARRFLRARGGRRLRLALLAEDLTAATAQRFRSRDIVGRQGRHVVLRSGHALQTLALQRVNVAEAAAIILPGDIFDSSEQQGEDVSNIKTLIALAGECPPGRQGEKPLVVAELQDARQAAVARAAYDGPLALIRADHIVNRLVVQQLRHPGIVQVYAALFAHDAPTRFYVRDPLESDGPAFGALAERFPVAVPCGLLRPQPHPDGGSGFAAWLNPPPSAPLQAGDRLVFLADRHVDIDATLPRAAASADPEDADDEDAADGADAADAAEPGSTHPPAPTAESGDAAPLRLLILGWNRRHIALLAELARQPRRSEVRIVSVVPAATRETLCRRVLTQSPQLQVTQIEADYVVASELAECRPQDHDAVFIAESESLATTEEADARTVVGYLVLQRLLAGQGRRPNILVELALPGNRSLLGEHADEVLITPLVLSHLLAQTTLRQELLPLYESLLGDGGADLALQPAADFVAGAEDLDAGELAARVGAAGCILLGWWVADAGARPVLNPDADEPLPAVDGTRLIVLSPGLAEAPGSSS